MKRIQQVSLSLFLLLCLLLSACGAVPGGTQTSFSLEDVPAFSGEPYVVLSDNQPGTATAINLGESASDWVGYTDAVDFYKFTRDSFTMENYQYSDFTGKIPVAL